MGWFSKRKETISVEFYAVGAGAPFAASEVPPDQLPDSFAIDTRLEIREKTYSVIEAAPALKTEFTATGKIKLTLQEIQWMNVNELLFSLPSVSNNLFAAEAAAPGDNLLLLNGDDWRQIEFVSASQLGAVKSEIESINRIYEQHRVGVGFDQLHIRKLIERPLLDAGINLKDLKHELAIIKEYDGFGIEGETSKAANGFAFQVAGSYTFYGQTENSFVAFLCVYETGDSDEVIGILIKKYDLVYVDWCACEITGE